MAERYPRPYRLSCEGGEIQVSPNAPDDEPGRRAIWLAHAFGWLLSGLSPPIRQAISRAIFPEVAFDPMTGLLSQAEFDLARAAADADPNVMFVLFDITDQGAANDYHGQDAGDALIIAAAAAVREAAALFGCTEVYRRGGDESGALASPQTALLIARTARVHLANRLASSQPLRDTKGNEHAAALFRTHKLYAVTGPTFAVADRRLRQAKAHYRLFRTLPEPE